jgi:sigma-B regulation protein RsbU (phosphoserine phosphatase)
MPVGLFQNGTYEMGTVTIPPKATLLVYTDGVIEARDSHGEEFGLARLIDLCADAEGNVQQLVSSIVAAVESWSGSPEPADDITLVAVAREG